MATQDIIVLGRITAPFGVRGWVKIHTEADDTNDWCALPQWWIAEDEASAQWQAVALERASLHGKGLIAKFAGSDDRDATTTFIGKYVGAPRRALPANPAGAYYWAELTGLRVENLAGEDLGRIERLMDAGAHPILCVRDADHERLLPFVADVVRHVDLEARKIIVDWQKDW